MLKRFKRIVLLGFLLPVALVLVFLTFERVRGKISLAHYKRVLAESGVTLDPEGFKTRHLEGENGATLWFKASEQLEKGEVIPDRIPPRMRLTPAGHGVVGFREPFWVEDRKTNHWEQVASDLRTNEPTLAALRKALAMPVLDNQIDFSQGFKMQFPHLSKAKTPTYWFGAASQLALRERRTHDSATELEALVRLSRTLENDHIVISELVRIAISAIARTAIWEAMQADAWEDADLARLQEAWEEQGFATNLVWAIRGELVLQHVSSDMMRKSHADALAMLFGMEDFFGKDGSWRPNWERFVRDLPWGEGIAEFLKRQVYARVWRFAWLDQDERYCLERVDKLLKVAQKAASGRSLVALQPLPEALKEPPHGVYDRLRYPDPQPDAALLRTVSRALMAETGRSLTLCAIALKRYSVRYGHWPERLGELVPAFLPSVPIDYMDGKPVRYRLDPNGGFKLYSVGEDGVDDGGDASPSPSKASSRMPWDRKDYVWPEAASPEEIQAYREESFARKEKPAVGERSERKTVKVIAINFDPVLRTRNNLRLHEYLKWSDPWKLTEKMVEDARVTSHGYVEYRVVEKIDFDGFPKFRNGFTYTEDGFLEMWEKDRNKANKGMTSFKWLFEKFDLAEKIRKQDIGEIWLWGAPYMQWDELHWKTPGDRIPFQTENPWFYRPYDIPDVGRTIWIMGWNYERGEGEMLESYCHRIESVLSLTVGKGVWDPKNVTNNVWNQFSRVDKDFPGEAEVGTVHYAPNSKSEYDWSNTNSVWTFADDWLSYPKLPRAKKLLNAATGGWAGIAGHHLWWMTRIPHAEGTTDGCYNNWWQYIVNYDEAVKALPPPGATFEKAKTAMYVDE